MKTYIVKAWRGTIESEREPNPLVTVLDSNCKIITDSYEWEYVGSLDSFALLVDKFMVYGNNIFVTQYSTFSQR